MTVSPYAYTGAGGLTGAILSALYSGLSSPVHIEVPITSPCIQEPPEEITWAKVWTFAQSEVSPGALAFCIALLLCALRRSWDSLPSVTFSVTFGGPAPRTSKAVRLSGYA